MVLPIPPGASGLEKPGYAAIPSCTLGVPCQHGFLAWRNSIEALLEAVASEAKPFAANLTVYHFSRFLCCIGRLDGARYSRDGARLSWCDLDHYLLHLPLERGLVAGDGLRVRPSDIVVLDLSRPAHFRMGASQGVSLLIPRTALVPLLADTGQLHGLVLRKDSAAGDLLGQLLLSLSAAAPRLALEAALGLSLPVLGLVAACLAQCPVPGAAVARPQHCGLARRVRLYIEQNLHREDLAPVLVAKELGVSRSQLYRALEKVGGLCRYLRQRRLRRSLLALCNAGNSGRRIVDLACEHGFADEAHFSRLFRQTFGLSPRAARAALQRGDLSALSGLVPHGSETPTFSRWVRELTHG